MEVTAEVKQILANYEGELPSVKQKLATVLMSGTLAGSGKLLFLAVDQGFEYGPVTFFSNPAGFSPHYHFSLAKEGCVSAYVAPLDWLRAGVDTFIGEVPMILKLNHCSSLFPDEPEQVCVASVQDALDLGCVGVGFTIYPGSDSFPQQLEELRETVAEARSYGMFTVVWAYPRGNKVSSALPFFRDGNGGWKPEKALNAIAYSAHMACLAGAHIVKVNLPGNFFLSKEAGDAYESVQTETLRDRVRHIVDCCFSGKRLVLFSGGPLKESLELIDEVREIREGGGYGSIIGRNIFQRPKEEAIKLIGDVAREYAKLEGGSSAASAKKEKKH
ncbi:MAG: class I fructose-bisphosphate aldolase [Holosporales bacterium]|jgi:class I fructose-bisphosphate aldolase|nr:class I fructose-bisphosphate aldolase [Holosporales bacterium]